MSLSTMRAERIEENWLGERWSRLVSAIESLSSARCLDEIVEIVRATARDIAGADGVTFVLRDGDLCHYVVENAISSLWAGRKFPLSTCISGWCMLTGSTAVIPDIYADSRIPHDAYRLTFVKSLVMTPIRVGDPLAAIGAYWRELERPTPETVSLLETLARSTATAMANVQLITSLTASEQMARRQLETQRLLIEELNHRVKNTLAIVQAMAAQTLRRARDPRAFVEGFEGRLQALSRSHELFTRTTWNGTDLATLIAEHMAIEKGAVAERIAASGPPVLLEPQTAQYVGLVLHELASNARKHGALSAPDGRVDVTWSLNAAEPPELALRWSERDGPPVTAPASKGFGSLMIEKGLRHIGGEANLAFAATGACCELRLPLISSPSKIH